VSDDPQPIGEDDLMAYMDGQLPPGRRETVEAFLDSNPSVRSRVFADNAIRDDLRRRLNPIAEQPIPDRLRVDAVLRGLREARLRRIRSVAACIALLGIGGAAGWGARDLLPAKLAAGQQAFMVATVADAVAAHRVFSVETVHPVDVGAAQEPHLVQWLSRRIGHRLAVPDLSRQGYVLMGGRLLPAGNEAAAQFMYENGSGGRMTVYVRASPGDDTRFRFAGVQGVSIFSWIDQGLGFAIVGAIDRPQLLDLADSVYQQLDPQHRQAPSAS
jgi:anti-sigma factor RsiW